MKHLGGEDYIEMEQQQLRASKEKLKEAIIMDMATRGGTSSLLRDEIPTQSITIPQHVASTQNVTSRQTILPMQEVTSDPIAPSLAEAVNTVVESARDKKTEKR